MGHKESKPELLEYKTRQNKIKQSKAKQDSDLPENFNLAIFFFHLGKTNKYKESRSYLNIKQNKTKLNRAKQNKTVIYLQTLPLFLSFRQRK